MFIFKQRTKQRIITNGRNFITKSGLIIMAEELRISAVVWVQKY